MIFRTLAELLINEFPAYRQAGVWKTALHRVFEMPYGTSRTTGRPDDKVAKIRTYVDTVIQGRRARIFKKQWQYLYDAMGNRVKTTETDLLTATVTGVTHHVYNAGGNMMATYDTVSAYRPAERYIYGTERVGLMRGINLGGQLPTTPLKEYEIKDHLGNVRVVVSAHRGAANYNAVVKNFFNYYAFGSLQPGRYYNAPQYRFGFNGQKREDVLKGAGNHNTAKFWEYDTRLGRRWNIDPVDQVSISNYATFGNNPILFSDVLGDERGDPVLKNEGAGAKGTPASNGGIKNGDGSISGGMDVCYECGPRGEHTWGVPDENPLGGSGILNLMQAAQEDIGRNDMMREKVGYVNQAAQGWMIFGITAPVAGFAALEGSAGVAVYQGTSWLVRNYGRRFLIETGKELFANRFNLKKMDWNDIFVSTATFKANKIWQTAGTLYNVSSDFTSEKGFRSGFLGTKDASNIMIDLSSEGTKMLIQYKMRKNAWGPLETEYLAPAVIDQFKAGVNDYIDRSQQKQNESR